MLLALAAACGLGGSDDLSGVEPQPLRSADGTNARNSEPGLTGQANIEPPIVDQAREVFVTFIPVGCLSVLQMGTWLADPATGPVAITESTDWQLVERLLGGRAARADLTILDPAEALAAVASGTVEAALVPLRDHADDPAGHVVQLNVAGDCVDPVIDGLGSVLPVGVSPHEPPAWLGSRELEPLGDTGFGMALPTPPALVERRLAGPDILPPPPTNEFRATVGAVPSDIVARSTYGESCPVALDELRYLTLSFWGFDGSVHTGEMIVNARVSDDVVSVFAELHRARFPIEEMRVRSRDEIDRHRTGDGNVTKGFECRRVASGSGRWSNHAYGLAVDINPFHNPYVQGELLVPELAGAYLDRSWERDGMILEDGVVTAAFDAIGWGWGGRWSSSLDYMHFSHNGR